ncbi:hypothetical protein FB446DRAFT_709633 [Lentinula raphanica]|nr:hypothetical protein FB446DRAFT_709633 [Lentinula raphanica]
MGQPAKRNKRLGDTLEEKGKGRSRGGQKGKGKGKQKVEEACSDEMEATTWFSIRVLNFKEKSSEDEGSEDEGPQLANSRIRPLKKPAAAVEASDSPPVAKSQIRALKKSAAVVEASDSPPVEKSRIRSLKKSAAAVEASDSPPVAKSRLRPLKKTAAVIEASDSPPVAKSRIRPLKKSAVALERSDSDVDDSASRPPSQLSSFVSEETTHTGAPPLVSFSSRNTETQAFRVLLGFMANTHTYPSAERAIQDIFGDTYDAQKWEPWLSRITSIEPDDEITHQLVMKELNAKISALNSLEQAQIVRCWMRVLDLITRVDVLLQTTQRVHGGFIYLRTKMLRTSTATRCCVIQTKHPKF